MILKGSQRGDAKQLADHLNNIADNEHVGLHSIRGFIAHTLEDALKESYAISRGTNAAQHLFSLSLNPPPSEEVTVADFENALTRIESKLGLSDQPRVVVFHEKEARRHAHAVYCRVDSESMTAINLPFFKTKLRDVSRELFLEHKWKMPKGLMNSQERTSNEFTLAELHQSKRFGQNRDDLKLMFQDCWAVSDTRQSFEAALKERGFLLAQGDRRGFVAIGFQGEVYSLSRMTGVKTVELEDKLGPADELPGVEECKSQIATSFETITKQNIEAAEIRLSERKEDLERKRQSMLARHQKERAALEVYHRSRLLTERRERQRQLSRGLTAVWETLSGKRARLIRRHKLEDQNSIRRDLKERHGLITRQLDERGRLQILTKASRNHHAREINAALALSSREVTQESLIVKRVRKNPELILSMLTEKESTFTRSKIVKELNIYIVDKQENQRALATVLSSSQLVELPSTQQDSDRSPRYSTREMIALESKLVEQSSEMANGRQFKLPRGKIKVAIEAANVKLMRTASVSLSDEQRKAIRHITSEEQIACVVGVAGAGKSTMLAAARQAWEDAGHRVFGAALAGKAAKGLEQSSGIKSRTLASFEKSWENERHLLQRGDILVVDEAGMIGSRQLAKFISQAADKGAKLVLVGDSEQLQPISAGAPFRTITETIGNVALHKVHRQKLSWQKQASQALAQGQTEHALQAYDENGDIKFCETSDETLEILARNYMDDLLENGDMTSRLALAHRRADVKALNDKIRDLRKACGDLGDEITYKTEHGKRAFAGGDRLLFTKNDHALGVKNGMLGTIIEARENKLIVNLDSDDKTEKPLKVTVDLRDYDSVNHGYATTIHKSQGATVDKSFVLASRTLDRHLTYVAMSRHKNQTKLYVDKQEFKTPESLYRSLSRERRKRSTFDFGKISVESVQHSIGRETETQELSIG